MQSFLQLQSSVIRNFLLGSAGISSPTCYSTGVFLLDEFGRIKVHFSLLMRFSPAELLVRCPGKLHFVISGVLCFFCQGRSKFLHRARKGINAPGPIMIFNSPTLLQTLLLCKT